MQEDYKEVGLKVGLEVHQQLETGKLFCRCPSILRDEKPNRTFERRLRPVPSELGEYDKAALEQFKRGISYLYEYYDDSNCLVELDEEPIKEIDEQALKIAIEIALLSNAKIMDEVSVMRKTVIDGSNTSGFQRTALIALGGKIKLKEKEISIQTIILEEDAARPIEKKENKITYRLDRLGIPLIELSTAPEIFSPEEAKEAAIAIGEIFRITGKVKRGLGTIRQDINISIKKGARVEIKGIQELELIGEYVRREVQRQLKLIELKEELEKRGIKKEELKEEFFDLGEVFAGTSCSIIKEKMGKAKLLGVKLKGFAGLIGLELQQNRRFGTELADYVKAKTQAKGIFHSDELPKYGISEEEVKKTKEKLNCKERDAFVIVCEEKKEAENALKEVVERCIHAFEGVPEETRDAVEEGNTKYSRPLPGAARMYPETDIAAIKISKEEIQKIRKELPLSTEERCKLYITKFSLSPQLAEKMKSHNKARFFEQLVQEKKLDATQAAVLLLEGIVQLKRDGVQTERISEKMIGEVLKALKEKHITKEVHLEVLKEWSKNPEKSLEKIISSMQLGKTSEEELKNAVKKIIEKNKKLIEEKKEMALSALMGEAMKELKGKASGAEISRILKEELKKMI